MHIKKIVVAAAAASAIGLASVATVASAQTSSTSLVDKIAQKFNLNKADVQKVFDENRTAKQTDREAQYEARLTQAVKDGKLTEDQKSKILAKHKELVAEMDKNRASMQAERQAMQSKTEAERQALRDQKRTEMDKQRQAIQDWEKANGIPAGYLFGGEGGRHAGGHGPGPGPGGPF